MAVDVGESGEKVLDRMVESGFFESENEAVRAAVLNYAAEMGFLEKSELWEEIDSTERRKVTPEQLKEDLEKIEDEA